MADYGHWFSLADADGDGRVSGGEEIPFFRRSGLSQEKLGVVWQLADQPPRGFLERVQFNAAMQLISVAQVISSPLHVTFSAMTLPETANHPTVVRQF